jgi:hypothetical protein
MISHEHLAKGADLLRLPLLLCEPAHLDLGQISLGRFHEERLGRSRLCECGSRYDKGGGEGRPKYELSRHDNLPSQ